MTWLLGGLFFFLPVFSSNCTWKMQRKLDSQINCQIIILDSSIKTISAKINTRYHSKTLGTGHNLEVVNLWRCIMSMSLDRRPLPALVGAAQNRNSWWLDTFETSSETYPAPNHIRINLIYLIYDWKREIIFAMRITQFFLHTTIRLWNQQWNI